MARRRSLESDLDDITALRRLAGENERREELRRALEDRRPLVAGKAARVAADCGHPELGPEIATALVRLLGPEGKGGEPPADPGCLGKTELARALVDLETEAFKAFRRGARCVQKEPVWGGEVDAAAELRGLCALGLGYSRSRGRGDALADLLADPEPVARSGAVRALAGSGLIGAGLLLRYKAHLGDDEPAVLLDTFSGLLELEPESVQVVADGLSSPIDTRFEAAAIALGSSRHPEASTLLIAAAKQDTRWRPDRHRILWRAIALLRDDQAADHLVGVVSEAPEETAILVLEVLGEVGASPRLRDQLADAVDARGSREIHRAFRALGCASG